MAKNRIVCLFLVAGIVLFHIFYVAYFSYYLLLFTILVLLVSLLVFLFSLFHIKSALLQQVSNVELGDAFTLTWHIRPGFLFACISAQIVYTNLYTGEVKKTKHRQLITRWQQAVSWTYTPAHCGMVVCEMQRCKVYDLLGVFSWRKKLDAAATVLCMPAPLPLFSPIDFNAPVSLRAEKTISMTNPYGPYDLRAYRPGDPLKNVHWKMSAKTDALTVKEYMDDPAKNLYLLVDASGDAAQSDRTLGYLAAFVEQALEYGLPLQVMHIDPSTNLLSPYSIASRQSYLAFLAACLSSRPGKESAAIIRGYAEAEQANKRLFYIDQAGITDISCQTQVVGRLL